MTREEQARQAIIDWQYDGSEPETFEVGFLEGVKWADEHPRKGLVDIDKACKYLEEHHSDLWIDSRPPSLALPDYIEKFVKAMND